MDHYIPVVEQDPPRVRGAFGVKGMDILLLQTFGDGIGNRFYLAGALPGADDEIVGKTADITGVQ